MIYNCCKPVQPAAEFASLSRGDTVLIRRLLDHWSWQNPVSCDSCGTVTHRTPIEGLSEELGEARVILVRQRIAFHGIVHSHYVEAYLSNGMHFDLRNGKFLSDEPAIRDEQTGKLLVDGSLRITLPTTEETQ